VSDDLAPSGGPSSGPPDSGDDGTAPSYGDPTIEPQDGAQGSNGPGVAVAPDPGPGDDTSTDPDGDDTDTTVSDPDDDDPDPDPSTDPDTSSDSDGDDPATSTAPDGTDVGPPAAPSPLPTATATGGPAAAAPAATDGPAPVHPTVPPTTGPGSTAVSPPGITDSPQPAVPGGSAGPLPPASVGPASAGPSSRGSASAGPVGQVDETQPGAAASSGSAPAGGADGGDGGVAMSHLVTGASAGLPRPAIVDSLIGGPASVEPTTGPSSPTPGPDEERRDERGDGPRGSFATVGPNQLFDPTLIGSLLGPGDVAGAAGAAASTAGTTPGSTAPASLGDPTHNPLADLLAASSASDAATAPTPGTPPGGSGDAPPPNAPTRPALGPTGQPAGDLLWDPERNQWRDPSTGACFTQFGPAWYDPGTDTTDPFGASAATDPSGTPIVGPSSPTPSWPDGDRWLAATIFGSGSGPPSPDDPGADAWAEGCRQALDSGDWDAAVGSILEQGGDAAAGPTPAELPDACRELVRALGTDDVQAMVGTAWHACAMDQFARTFVNGGPVEEVLGAFPEPITEALSADAAYYVAYPQELHGAAVAAAGSLFFRSVVSSAIDQLGASGVGGRAGG
jgi:hypothetical protein